MEPCIKRPRFTVEMAFPPSLEDGDNPVLQVLCGHWINLARQGLMDQELEIEIATELLERVNQRDTIDLILGVVGLFCKTSIPDKLTKALMRVCVMNIDIDTDETKEAQLLHQLSFCSSLGKELYTAFCVIKRKAVNEGVDQKLYKVGISLSEGIEPAEQDFCHTTSFLWALSHCKDVSRHMALMDHVMNFLVRTNQSQTLGMVAKSNPNRRIAVRLEDLVKSDHLDPKRRAEAISGLLLCIDFVHPSAELLDAIMESSLEGSEYSLASANLVCHLIDRDKVAPENLVYLLETDCVEIWKIVVSYVAKQGTLLIDHPNILNSVAKMASRDAAQALRLDVISILSKLFIKREHEFRCDHHSNQVDLVRNPHIVETLVKTAPNPMAMELLYTISTPVSNRRILATHPGLLSSWIRFLRVMPPDEPLRNEWKDRLVSLANLL